MRGHNRLHDRVTAALDRCQESQDVDFKESAGWPQLRYRIMKAAMAMANLRDGGVVIVGVSERNAIWELTGISEVDLASFEADDIIEEINSVASPHIVLDVVLVTYRNGNRFLAIQANEFGETPIVCKKTVDSRTTGEPVLEQGAVYIRPAGVAQTIRITDARQMHALLELSAEKRARHILEAAARIGLVAGAGMPATGERTATQRFDEELGNL